MTRRLIIAAAAVALLAGCGAGTQTASFLISGGDVALTLERTKPYPWSEGWQLEMVARNENICQRRHTLKDAGDGPFTMEVFTWAPGVFILHQGKRWYVTDLATCDLQQYQEPPPEPGTLVGAFQPKSGVLAFALEKPAADPAPAAAEAPTAPAAPAAPTPAEPGKAG